ncbi:MAG: amidohydrolase family protein [Chitinophagaceae bacterium]
MKLLFTLIASVSSFLSYCQLESSEKREIVFRSVNVIPMDKEGVVKNQVVVIKDGKIISLGSSKKVKYSINALVIDAKGKYLIPGISEMHAHVPPIDDIEPMKEVLLLFVTHGITTIRGMLGHPKHLELRSLINDGQVLGPRFYTSGPSINGTSVSSPAIADSMVTIQKRMGYDFLKIHPGLTLENFEAVVKKAKELKIPFAGHVPFDVGIWKVISAGYSTIEHLDGFIEALIPEDKMPTEKEATLFAKYVADRVDTTQIPKLIQALKEHHIWIVPTEGFIERWVTPKINAQNFLKEPDMKYMDTATLNRWAYEKEDLINGPRFDSAKMNAFISLRRRLISECNRNGVGLLLGTDAPQIFNVPGISTLHELEYLVLSGLTPYEALRTGTVNPAKFYNRSDLGIIKAGAIADLVLLDANPLENISNVEKIEGVMIGKKWLSKSFINETLKKLEKSK